MAAGGGAGGTEGEGRGQVGHAWAALHSRSPWTQHPPEACTRHCCIWQGGRASLSPSEPLLVTCKFCHHYDLRLKNLLLNLFFS